MKVLHLPTTVGGNPQGVSRHLRLLGVDSQSWTLRQNYFEYSADRVLVKPEAGLIRTEIARLLALRYTFQFDAVFFNYGTSLFQYSFNLSGSSLSMSKALLVKLYNAYASMMATLEVLLLKLRRVPILIQYQGDDARQGDFCRAHFEITFANRVEPGYYSEDSDAAKRRRIAFYARYADEIYALNPDLLHVLPTRARFLPYSHIDLTEWVPYYNQMESRPLRIGHAPSNRAVKGSDILCKAVEELKAAGLDFEFTLIEGVSNAAAKEIYKELDVLVDQLFAGWYGGVAVEAMALGKPVVSYIREQDLRFIPENMRQDLPIFNATPSNIQEVLHRIITMPRSELDVSARRSRQYVERWHDPTRIAQRIKSDIDAALNRNRPCAE